MKHNEDCCCPCCQIPRLESTIDHQAAEIERMKDQHCDDCCCARSWKALGIDKYTGKSIPEHIEQLLQEIERMKRKISSMHFDMWEMAHKYKAELVITKGKGQ